MSKNLRKVLVLLVMLMLSGGALSALKLPGNVSLDLGKNNKKSETKDNKADTKKVEMFQKHKQTILTAHDYLKDFYNIQSDSLVLEKVDEALKVIEVAESAVQELSDTIGGSLGNYDNVNDETKELNFGSKASRVSSYVNMSKERIAKLKINLLSIIKGRTTFLEGSKSVEKAARWYEEIRHNFEVLDRIAPNDVKVAEYKTEFQPRAYAAYKKAMEFLEDSRMESEKYSSSDADSLRNELAGIYTAKYKNKIARIVISVPAWVYRQEIVFGNDSLWLEDNYYIAAAVAIDDGKTAMVYSVNFKKTKGEKGFGPIQVVGVGGGYPVLSKYLNK